MRTTKVVECYKYPIMKTIECVICESCRRTIPKGNGFYLIIKEGTQIKRHNSNNTESTILSAPSDCAICDTDCLKSMISVE